MNYIIITGIWDDIHHILARLSDHEPRSRGCYSLELTLCGFGWLSIVINSLRRFKKVQIEQTGRSMALVNNSLLGFMVDRYSPRPFLNSFLIPSWRALRTYRPHLEERDPIWGDDWSHNPFIRRSPSWGFLGFSSAVRQMPRDLCTAPGSLL